MTHESAIRLLSFLLIFIMVALWEYFKPRRTLTTSKKWRWFNNLSITIINPIVLYLVLPIYAVEMTMIAQSNGWGFLNQFNMPYLIAFCIGFIVMDLVIYLQHVMFHSVPLLWRLHMMHHADLDIDLTTGLRFHPFEIILSMILKLVVIVAIGHQ